MHSSCFFLRSIAQHCAAMCRFDEFSDSLPCIRMHLLNERHSKVIASKFESKIRELKISGSLRDTCPAFIGNITGTRAFRVRKMI